MSFYKFNKNDIFTNTIETYPEYKYYVYSGSIYLDNTPHISGAHTDNYIGVPKGYISLYEYNIDREESQRIYPFLVKNGKRDCFKTISKVDFNSQYNYDGEIISSSYNMSASITREYIAVSTTTNMTMSAIRSALDHYAYLSPHYQYSSSYGWDKSEQVINLVSVPSILYGSSIKKGSVSLKYYLTGTLIGELQDLRNNGELVQVGPEGSTGSGSIAGVVLYNEGFVVLTGSWDIGPQTLAYDVSSKSKWVHYAFGANDGNAVAGVEGVTSPVSASFSLDYSGSTHTQTLTMLAHADYGELNWSNNPTYLSASEGDIKSFSGGGGTGSVQYVEPTLDLVNIVSASYTAQDPTYEKTTYITKIGLYDENRNLIGIAKVANPVRKTEDRGFIFKLKLDI
jgi:hypothetical protein